MVNDLPDAGAEIDVPARDLAPAHDIRQLVVSTLLTRLELFGIIQFDGYYYSDIRFAALHSSAEMLTNYSGEQALLLKKIFASCKKARKWITLDMEAALERTGQPRSVIIRMLETLQDQKHIKLTMAGYRQRFKRIQTTVDRPELCQKLTELFAKHEQLEINRIASMVDYAQEDTCLTNQLLAYFGEPIEPCGHCGVCQGDEPVCLPERTAPPIDPAVLAKMEELAQQNARALGQPRQQARFLCGLNSPAVSAKRGLRGNPLFGACAHIPFKDLHSQLIG